MGTQPHSPGLPAPLLVSPWQKPCPPAWEASGPHPSPLHGPIMAGQSWDPCSPDHLPKAPGAVGLSYTFASWLKEVGSGGALAKEA